MSCRSASTCTSSPCSRAVALVTGPIDTSRALAGNAPAASIRKRTVERGGEGHVVGPAPAPRGRRRPAARPPCRRAPPRPPGRPARASASGSTSRASAARATITRRPSTGTSSERLHQRLGDRARGHHVGADAVLGQPRGGARADRRDGGAGQRAGVQAVLGQAVQQQRRAVGAGQAHQRILARPARSSARARAAARSGWPASPPRRRPASRSRSASAAGLRARPRDGHVRPCSGRRSSQASVSRSAAPSRRSP